MKKIIAPSVLSADFTNIREQLKECEKGNAGWIHCDVMDGQFVPNITFGPFIVEQIKKTTNIPLDVHLMIENPDNFVEQFAKAGASVITVHQEAVKHLHRSIQNIKKYEVFAGVSLNPATPVAMIEEVLPDLDLVLIMSVNPGFGGQKFIEKTLEKINKLSEIKKKYNYNFTIEIDGGVTLENIKRISDAGCEAFVAGSSVFGSENIAKTIIKMNEIIN